MSRRSQLLWSAPLWRSGARGLSTVAAPNFAEKARTVGAMLAERKAAALKGGGDRRIEAQHTKGKLTARERLDLLLDEGTFREYDMLKSHRCVDFNMQDDQPPGDGVITGHGKINGR